MRHHQKEHAAYDVKAQDMNEAIDACGAAIDALKDSKAQMKGAKLNLAQVTCQNSWTSVVLCVMGACRLLRSLLNVCGWPAPTPPEFVGLRHPLPHPTPPRLAMPKKFPRIYWCFHSLVLQFHGREWRLLGQGEPA